MIPCSGAAVPLALLKEAAAARLLCSGGDLDDQAEKYAAAEIEGFRVYMSEHHETYAGWARPRHKILEANVAHGGSSDASGQLSPTREISRTRLLRCSVDKTIAWRAFDPRLCRKSGDRISPS